MKLKRLPRAGVFLYILSARRRGTTRLSGPSACRGMTDKSRRRVPREISAPFLLGPAKNDAGLRRSASLPTLRYIEAASARLSFAFRKDFEPHPAGCLAV